MFIDKMTSAELLQEYLADLPEIQEKTYAFDKSEYVTNYLYKRRKAVRVVIPKTMKSARGNKYLGVLIYTQSGSGQMKRWDWQSYHIGFMNTAKGLLALTFFVERGLAVKYTPHFFQRYKERLMDSCDWKVRNLLMQSISQEQIITAYVQRNLNTAWLGTKSVYKNRQHIFSPVPDGVALMQWDSQYKTMQANTFVTYNMLDEKQLTMIEKLIEYTQLSREEQEKTDSPLFVES